MNPVPQWSPGWIPVAVSGGGLIALDDEARWLTEAASLGRRPSVFDQDTEASGASSHPEDAPLLKTLLLLLYSPLLKSAHLGDRGRREMAAWDSVISAALDEELRNRAAQRGRTHD